MDRRGIYSSIEGKESGGVKMGMSGLFRAGISVLVGIVAMLVLEAVFPMDTIYIIFNNIGSTIRLSLGWHSVLTGVSNGWVWYDRSFVIVGIALFVWMASFAVSSVDYTKVRP
jgi:hypothetical protein